MTAFHLQTKLVPTSNCVFLKPLLSGCEYDSVCLLKKSVSDVRNKTSVTSSLESSIKLCASAQASNAEERLWSRLNHQRGRPYFVCNQRPVITLVSAVKTSRSGKHLAGYVCSACLFLISLSLSPFTRTRGVS